MPNNIYARLVKYLEFQLKLILHPALLTFFYCCEFYGMFICQIRVITKLPNSEQSYKGKVKTHNYINRQNQSTTGKL